MNKYQGHMILNAAQCGLPTRQLDILRALVATGDLSPTDRKRKPITDDDFVSAEYSYCEEEDDHQ